MVQDLLEQNCDQDHDIGTADNTAYHQPILEGFGNNSRMFPQQYLYQVRMRSAARMLVTTDLPIRK